MDQSQNDAPASPTWMDLPLSEIASLLNVIDLHLFVRAGSRVDWGKEEVRVFMESMDAARRNKFLLNVLEWADAVLRKQLPDVWKGENGG